MVKFRKCIFVNLMVIIAAISVLAGCSDRDNRPEPNDPDPSFQKAEAALNRAQAAMEKADVDINLSDIGTLGNLATILPNPMKLGLLEADALADAIVAMYEVLDAFGLQVGGAQAPANPAQAEPEISESDLALVQIHLAYLYVLEAVRILTIEGWGEDGVPDTNDDLFRISFPDEVVLENAEDLEKIYVFELTERGQATFDAIEANTSSRPEDYLKEFSESQRQAVLDALLLLLGAEVKVLAFPGVTGSDGKPITEQTHAVNRRICRQDALYHLEESLDVARDIAPDFEDAMDEFSELIAETFAEDFLDQTSQWGFEILNKQEVRRRLDDLAANPF